MEKADDRKTILVNGWTPRCRFSRGG